ncbi:MAG: hypothetical protein QG554_47 [Pseudomonadota bacterium]|jgi:hypothetical protein|nr:hypothetical protein [Pseudomonadota bacterium]
MWRALCFRHALSIHQDITLRSQEFCLNLCVDVASLLHRFPCFKGDMTQNVGSVEPRVFTSLRQMHVLSGY